MMAKEEKELKPKKDCPACKGKGEVVLIPGVDRFKVACTCKFEK